MTIGTLFSLSKEDRIKVISKNCEEDFDEFEKVDKLLNHYKILNLDIYEFFTSEDILRSFVFLAKREGLSYAVELVNNVSINSETPITKSFCSALKCAIHFELNNPKDIAKERNDIVEFYRDAVQSYKELQNELNGISDKRVKGFLIRIFSIWDKKIDGNVPFEYKVHNLISLFPQILAMDTGWGLRDYLNLMEGFFDDDVLVPPNQDYLSKILNEFSPKELVEYHEKIVSAWGYTPLNKEVAETNLLISQCLYLHRNKQYDRALSFYRKLIEFTKGEVGQDVYLGMGDCCLALSLHNEAKDSYLMATKGEFDYRASKAHLKLSILELETFKDYDLAKHHAYSALIENDISIEALLWLRDNFANENVRRFYLNRIEYAQEILSSQAGDTFKQYISGSLNILLRRWSSAQLDDFIIAVILNLNITLPSNYSIATRYRLAYLVSYRQGRPWLTYQIITLMRDKGISLIGVDLYFYLRTAYLIGENFQKLREIYELEDYGNPTEQTFKGHYWSLGDLIANAYAEDEQLDERILDIKLPIVPVDLDLIRLSDVDEIIKLELKSIMIPESFPGFTLGEFEIKGLISQLLNSKLSDINIPPNLLLDWENFVNSIEVAQINVLLAINNLRKLIRSKINYLWVLTKVLEEFHSTDSHDVAKRKTLSFIMAAIMISYNVDANNSYATGVGSEIATNCIVDLAANNFVSTLFEMTIMSQLGLSFAMGYLTTRTFFFVKRKLSAEKIDKMFSEIAQEANAQK